MAILRKISPFLNPKGLNRSTPDRSIDRYRRIIWSGLANGGATIVSMLVGLVSLPLTVNYLGAERYGLWIVIGSWVSLLDISDLGIGNSLLNFLAEANGRKDYSSANRYMSTALIAAGTISLLLGVLFLFIFPFIPWQTYLGVQTPAVLDEARLTVVIVLAFFLLNLPIGVTLRAYPAYQEGYKSHMWQIVGSLAGLVGVIMATSVKLGLPFLAFSIVFSRFAVTFVNCGYLFKYSKPWLRPSLSAFDRTSLKRLVKMGALYALANIGFLITLQAPYIVGPRAVSLETLGQFGVAHRFFVLALAFPLMFLAPLWPAYGEAITRLDLDWVRKTLRRTYLIGVGSVALLGLLLTVTGGWILTLFFGGGFTTDHLLLGLFSLWMFTRVWQEIHTMLLNGSGYILGVAIYGIITALSQLLFCYWLGGLWGNYGLALGWVLGFALFSGWLLPLDTFSVLRKLRSRQLSFCQCSPM